MAPTILATKLYIPPPRPQAVLRARLIEQLNAGLHRRLTLIAAPAGFGKTTLVSAWLAAGGQSAAWLALDAGDSDPTRFLTYLAAAVQGVAGDIGEGVWGLLQSPQPPVEPIVTALLNAISAHPGRMILVLDDYHLVDAPAVDQALAFLVEHQPPQLHLVMTTREDPNLPLARLRARDQLTELRVADLRFTPAEAAEFLHRVMGLNLAADEVAALAARTEGWIAGLQLSALSVRGREDAAAFVRAFAGSHRYIVDYLVAEVLERQPEAVRRFLLQTAILDRLCGPLCDAVTGQEDGGALLEALERANLFVAPLDDGRRWYRYHQLFAEALVNHLAQQQPAQPPLLHRRASAWYAANGLPAAAIRHALAAPDFAAAADLLELAWPAMDGRFQAAAWLAWAQALPPELVRARPVLAAAYAWALLNQGELEAAADHLQAAERGMNPALAADTVVVVDAEQYRTLPASLATARAYLAQAQGDVPGSIRYGQQALDLLPTADHLRRGPAAALLGLAQWANGDLEAAHHTLAAARHGFQQAGNLHFALSVVYGLAEIRTTQGRLHAACRTYEQALQLATAQGQPLRGAADLQLGLSTLYLQWGDLDAARQHLRQGEESGAQAGLPDWRYRLHRMQARFCAAEGNLAGALDQLAAAEQSYYPTPLPDVRPLAAERVRVWLKQGRLPEALRWVQEQGLTADDDLRFLAEFEHITLARVLLAVYQHNRDERAGSDAIRLLARLQVAAEAGGRLDSLIEIEVLGALAAAARDSFAPALATLERTLRLAEPENYVRVFVDEGPPLARLLQAVAQGSLRDYAARLLAAFAPVESAGTPQAIPVSAPAPAPSPPRSEPLIEPLSARELEVLQLIAQGLSNQEIGARLYLALNTVKGHNQAIFGKLQVQRRTEAVARARQLGLL